MFRRQSKKWSQVTSKWRGRCTLWPGHRVRISSRRRVLAVSGSCFGFQRISISIFYSKPQSENSHFSHRFLITLFTYSPRFFFRSSRISNTKHSLFFLIGCFINAVTGCRHHHRRRFEPDWMMNQSTKVDQSAAEMSLTYLTKMNIFSWRPCWLLDFANGLVIWIIVNNRSRR